MASDEVTIQIHEVDGVTVLVSVEGPSFRIELIGEVLMLNGCLYVRNAHVQGAFPGALGRAGLNAIGRKLLLETGVDELVIEGGTRTTGRAKGRTPRPFRDPHGV